MHGFPDNLHLYDRLVPPLGGRRLVLFDFLGWGRSDKPADYGYTFEDQKSELDAVIAALNLSRKGRLRRALRARRIRGYLEYSSWRRHHLYGGVCG
jgi:pimeloyl-ACP methyl ester carboxylesterase